MESDPDIVQLLTEIRDNQRKQIDAYEAKTQQSLAMQEEAVVRQRKVVTLYVRSLVVGGVVVAGLVVLLAYLLRLL